MGKSLGLRITAAFFVIIFLTGMVVIDGTRRSQKVTQEYRKIIACQEQITRKALELRGSLFREYARVQSYALTKSPEIKTEYENEEIKSNKDLDELHGLTPLLPAEMRTEYKGLLKSINESRRSFIEYSHMIFSSPSSLEEPDSGSIKDNTLDIGEPAIRRLNVNVQSLLQFVQQSEAVNAHKAEVLQRQNTQVVYILFAMSLLASIAAAYAFARDTVHIIRKLTFISRDLAKGNFDTDIPEFGRSDELGALASSFGLHAAAISELMSRLGHIFRRFDDSCSDLSRLGDRTSSSSKLLADSIDQISAAVDSGYSKACSISDSIDLIANTSLTVANITDSLDEKNRTSFELAEKNCETFNSVVSDVQIFNDDLSASKERVSALTTKVISIIGVADSISDFAAQTNRLALSASIEAAGAGEYGLGFNVIAQEIRRLAESSSQSAKEITAAINAARQDIFQTSDVLGQSYRSLTRFSKSILEANGISEELRSVSRALDIDVSGLSELVQALNRDITGISESLKGISAAVYAAENYTRSSAVSISDHDEVVELMLTNIQYLQQLVVEMAGTLRIYSDRTISPEGE